MPIDALIEKAARAVMAHFHPGVNWDTQPRLRREWYQREVRAALLAVLPDIGEHLAGVVDEIAERHRAACSNCSAEGLRDAASLASYAARSTDDAATALRAEVRRLTGGGDD